MPGHELAMRILPVLFALSILYSVCSLLAAPKSDPRGSGPSLPPKSGPSGLDGRLNPTRQKVSMKLVIPQSPSHLLRASHVLAIRVETVTATEWAPEPAGGV